MLPGPFSEVEARNTSEHTLSLALFRDGSARRKDEVAHIWRVFILLQQGGMFRWKELV